MKSVCLLLLGLVAGSLAAPVEEETTGNKLSPRAGISFDISTPDFGAWGERAKDMVKKPTEIAKDSVDIVKDSVKMGTGIGGAAVAKGTDLASQGVTAATDLTKMGIDMGTTIADKTLGIVSKVGDMIPIAGGLVTSGAGLGQQGVNKVKDISKSLMDSINKWAGSGLGWVKDTTAKGNAVIDSAADSVSSTIHKGLDYKADTIGNVIAAGLNTIPEVKVSAGVNVG